MTWLRIKKREYKDKLTDNQNKKSSLIGNCGDYQGAVVISTKITKVAESLPETQKTSASLISKKSSTSNVNVNSNVNSKSKNNLIKISNNSIDGNGEGTEGEKENDQLLITLRIAIFNLKYSFWMIVEGNFIGNAIKNKNENIKVNINLQKKNLNLENTELDFTVLESMELKKEFDVFIVKIWKLPSSVSIFSFLEDRSMVALGLNNGRYFILKMIIIINFYFFVLLFNL